MKKWIIYLLFLFISLSPFLWHKNLLHYSFIGSADFLSPIDLNHTFSRYLYVYSQKFGGGIDQAFLTSYIFTFQGFYIFFQNLGLSSPVITMLLISTMIFISQISMFKFLQYVLAKKIEIQEKEVLKYSAFGAILYGFSPYLVGIISPGHFIQLYSYMLFPLLLLNLDKFLDKIHFSWKNIFYLYLIFFISAPSYANIGILYVTFLIIGVYTLVKILVEKQSVIKSLLRLFYIFILALLANIWWLLAFISSFAKAVQLNIASNNINNVISTAVQRATINNILLGRAENTLFSDLGNKYYINDYILFIFSVFFIFVILALIYKQIKKGYLFLLSSLLIISAYITKGTQAPFSFIFNWFYLNIPGFQIFRRPVSKFYWFFLLIFFSLTVIGAVLTKERIKNKFILILIDVFFIFSTMYLVISFIKTPLLIPFNVPHYYSEGRKYLEQTSAKTILLLPGFYGTYPTYNASINNYYGSDFIDYLWDFQILVPDSTSYSINTPVKKEVGSLMTSLNENDSICENLINLGITHVIVRQDINVNAAKEDNENVLIQILKEKNEISEYKEFKNHLYSGFTVFKVANQCRGNSLVNSDINIDYQVENPVTIKIHSKDPVDSFKVDLLLNESDQWKLFTLPTSGKFNPLLSLINYYPIINKTKSINGTYNEWTIKSLHHDFVLYYKEQDYFYLGFIIFAIINLSGLLILFLRNDKGRDKKISQ